MSSTLRFLPWLRRGLGLSLTNRDRGGDLARNQAIRAFVELDHVEAATSLSLRPVDHATGIDAAQIIRRYPAPGGGEAEYGYFPLVELAAPDLPWVLTPAAPDEAGSDPLSTGRLRPWLVLVCVEEDLAELTVATDGRPARLTAPPDQLPDLAESHAWAHVQSAVDVDEVVASLTSEPGAVIARLVCPRRLAPDTRYRAALVAAFRVEGDDLKPAWSPTDAPEPLVVFDTWTFATGQAGSFEELCERLHPVEDPSLVLGLHPTDVTDLGPLDPWPKGTKRVVVDYAGALWDADVRPDELDELAGDFEDAVAEILDQSDYHVELAPGEPDPVVTPPLHGAYPARADSVPTTDGWLRSLNLDPDHRAQAGLGAQIVRIHQERFMAAAWQQAGELRETNRQLTFTRLQGEIGRTWKARTDALDAHARVAVVRPQLSFVRDEQGRAPRRSIQQSTFPNALVSPAYLRATRPGAAVATAAAGRNPAGWSWSSSVGETFGDPTARDEIGFGVFGLPAGTRLADPRRADDATDEPGGPIDDPGPGDDPNDPDGPLPLARTTRRTRASRSTGPADLDLGEVASLATEGIDPLGAARTRIAARIPGLVTVLDETDADELPTSIAVGPVIDEALVWSLVDLSPELLLPGVEEFPDNAVRVVETNPAFVASFLAGANHEMARELLWREFPADMAATTFRRFWDRPDPTAGDITPMTEWKESQELEQLGAVGGDSVVVLIRGDLVRHYPTVRILLVDPEGVASLPSFSGWIPPDVRFMAYAVTNADAVTAPGTDWEVVFEEQPSEPRFGLDTLGPDDALPDLASWDELCWDHLDGQGDAGHLVIGTNGFPSSEPPPTGATWGLNSAHMARATYQKPYRFTFPVSELIGRPS